MVLVQDLFSFTFGKRLAARRKKKGYTQQEFADKIGMSKMSLQRYEQGKTSPNYHTLARIAGVLGEDADVLTRKTLTIFEAIDQELECKSISRRELAKLSGMNPSALQDAFEKSYERGYGRIDMDDLVRICGALGVSVFELTEGTDLEPGDFEKQSAIIVRDQPGRDAAGVLRDQIKAAADELSSDEDLRTAARIMRALADTQKKSPA